MLNESKGEDDCDTTNLLEEGFVNIHTPYLDPMTPGDKGEMFDDLTQQDQDHFIHNINEIGYSYNDFLFFDKRTEEEKLFRKGGSRKQVSQNQVYFFQKY